MTISAVLVLVLAAVTLLATGAVAGLFYAYSVSVMWGLDGIAPRSAVAAMQRINQVIVNPWFFPSFLGAPLAQILMMAACFALDLTGVGLVFLGAAVSYLAGAFLVTVRVNIPLNDALERTGRVEDEDEAARLWSSYSPRWTRWNHLRTGASLTSLLLVGGGILLLGSQLLV